MNDTTISLLRENFLHYAWSFIGTFYSWGGDDPAAFDCSGFAGECTQSIGLTPRGMRLRARDLYDLFKEYEVLTLYGGCLMFRFDNGVAAHVEICINRFQTIAASGGGSKTLTKEDAVRDNAFIKVRPIQKGSNYKYVDPFKSLSEI
jgi:cell wall-associated NlpC family hydrolase